MRPDRRWRHRVTGLLGLLAGAGCGDTAPDRPGVFVLGIDGMDPTILQRLMDEGKAPEFARLARDGGFQDLATVTPPQSPVAWSSFVTGVNPGGHGIYDFVHRDPRTYLPISSATPANAEHGKAVDFFGWYIPLSGGTTGNNRSGTPFWDRLVDAGVDVEVYRIPGNYPPPESDAKVLAGMGSVDMRGGYGVYTWYTDQPVPNKDKLKGDVQLVTVNDFDLDGVGDTVQTKLKGAPDLFHLPPGQIPGPSDYLDADVTFHVDAETETLLVRTGDGQAIVREGEWSDWVPVHFDALPMGMMALQGAVRFYAREVRPGFVVYASPVNMSAESPPQPITSPDDWASDLAGALGQFYTQGMPEETNALRDRLFTDDDYLSQVALVQDDTEQMLSLALSRFERGDMTFLYVSDIDLNCHMLWRHGDPKTQGAPPHPAYDPATGPGHARDIENFYRNVDRLLGVVRSRLPQDSLLLVMSDHGFQPFTRQLHLDSWLRDQGYLVLKDGKRTGQIALGDVDWTRTRAYGLGFNSLYLNLKGREKDGIVDPAQADALVAEISARLLELTDPKTGSKVVKRVDRARDVYRGTRIAEAPDLIVGYDRGFGGSDETTLGEIREAVLEDNTSRWSGNHLMAPEVVPGVLLSNRTIPASGHGLTDVTATLLSWWGLPLSEGMDGKPIFDGP